MSSRAKERAVFTFVTVLAVWPLVHIALVKRFDMSPWRFGGWGMYSQPTRAIQLSIAVEEGGEVVRIHHTSLPPELVGRIREFNRRRDALGTLLLPEAIAESVLELHPNAQSAILTVSTFQVAADSALMEKRSQTYRYPVLSENSPRGQAASR